VKNLEKKNIGISIINVVLTVLLGTLLLMGLFGKEEIELNTGFILIQNQSDDWHWLQNQEFTRVQLSELYTLKNILIDNECVDGGFIENIDGERFAIICYQGSKILEIGGEQKNEQTHKYR